jgi:toxin ParE1/3/4
VAAPPVAWTLPARQDLLKAIRYFAEQSPAAAEKLLNRLEAAADSIAHFPERGRTVPELGLPRREVLVGDYRLVYRVRSGEIEVLRVIHDKQDFLRAWKEGLQP